MTKYILAIDQGTTSSRAIVFDGNMQKIGSFQEEFRQVFPQSGWVEHDPEAIWNSVLNCIKNALEAAKITAESLAAIGITNQRETVLSWDKKTGQPLGNAIVWQDRRTSDICAKLKSSGQASQITEKTGLVVDSYFSATKIAWLLDHQEGARQAAADGKLLAGTIDSFLIWRLTGGKSHVTDITNAARTMLFNISDGQWDIELCQLFNVPIKILPTVLECADQFGITDPAHFGSSVPILGVAGDQQAAAIGQCCFEPGMAKSTYGTGCFALLNTGETKVKSTSNLLTTIAYKIDGKLAYALEGSIFIAGAAVQWLRDGLGIIEKAAQSGEMAAKADDTQDVYLVPAFVGLGAPWWDADARGTISGLSRNTGPNEIACAALESVAYQTYDLLEAMKTDWPKASEISLRVDGGMVTSDWTMQRLADILNTAIERPVDQESTALGAAWLAGYKAGLYPSLEEFSRRWQLERKFSPSLNENKRQQKIAGWHKAISRTLSDNCKDNGR